MHINTPDAASTQRLEQLVAKTDFLRLTTSNAHYPNAMGAGLPLLIVETALCSAVISLQVPIYSNLKPQRATLYSG
jgi:glucose-6-phosphate 1-epimerase